MSRYLCPLALATAVVIAVVIVGGLSPQWGSPLAFGVFYAGFMALQRYVDKGDDEEDDDDQ